MKRYTIKEINFLKENYPLRGMVYCSQKLNRSTKSVSWKANHLGLKLLPNIRSQIMKRVYSKRPNKLLSSYKVNPILYTDNFTKESSYILGLLWADGNIYSKGHNNRITLECIKTDIDIFLPIFQKTGDWNTSFRNRPNRQPQGTIQTGNKPLCDFLVSNNYGPHNIKSANLILDKIPDNLKNYWYRGLIDGDGCWYIHIERKLYQFALSGSYEQDWLFVELLFKKLNIKYSIQRATPGNNKYSAIRVTNKCDIVKFGEFVYKNYPKDNIGLRRKYDKYLEIKSYL